MECDKNVCPVVNVDGFIECGKQFDLDITLPEDNRNVIYGIVRDCYKEPVCDAVVKLIEVVCECGKEERRPVSHTFTDKDGQFVFGPLCPNRFYEVAIWVNDVKHVKVCAECDRKCHCIKGVKIECKECFKCHKDECHKNDCHKDNCHKDECHKDNCHRDA